jgi:hypothetical protein
MGRIGVPNSEFSKCRKISESFEGGTRKRKRRAKTGRCNQTCLNRRFPSFALLRPSKTLQLLSLRSHFVLFAIVLAFRTMKRSLTLLMCLALAFFAASTAHALSGQVKHFVAFRFLPSVSQTQKAFIMQQFLDLKYQCVNATTGLPYIVSLDAGYANSPEGADQGMQEGFIVTFNNIAERNYYVGRPFYFPYDPAHDAFKTFVGPFLDKNGAFVFDFTVQ